MVDGPSMCRGISTERAVHGDLFLARSCRSLMMTCRLEITASGSASSGKTAAAYVLGRNFSFWPKASRILLGR